MDISKVLAAVAVSDLEQAKDWYATFLGRPAEAEPMPEVVEWRSDAGTLQLVVDRERAGGSLVTLQVSDARAALEGIAEPREGDAVIYATVSDPDGNGVTVVQVKPGVDL